MIFNLCFKNSLMKKGFLSFTLVLLLIPLILLVSDFNSKKFSELSKLKENLIQIEKSGFLRSEIELNFDHFFLEFLEKELSSETELLLIKKIFSLKFYSLIKSIEEVHPNIKFFKGKFSKENYSSILESNERELIDLSFIEESFSFLIVQLNSGNFRVERKELSFTGGTERKVIFAVINLSSFEQIFVLPLDYKISI